MTKKEFLDNITSDEKEQIREALDKYSDITTIEETTIADCAKEIAVDGGFGSISLSIAADAVVDTYEHFYIDDKLLCVWPSDHPFLVTDWASNCDSQKVVNEFGEIVEV